MKSKAMNRNFILCLLFALSTILNSCHKSPCCVIDASSGNWIKRSTFPGIARAEAISFVIGNYAYLGTGVDVNFKRLNDFWQYDPVNDAWSQKANLPANSRNSAIGLTIGNYGYVGTGYTGTNLLKDFWQYDPENNSWIQKANFAGTARYDAVAFGIQNYGYIATGFDTNSLKDCWQYDPSSDSWKQRADLKGNARSAAVSFVYNNQAYIVTGNNNGNLVDDFWKFDPSQPDSIAWTQLRNISNSDSDSYDDGYNTIERTNAVAFTILNTKSNGGGDREYLTTGDINASQTKWTWAYNFQTDLWNQVTSFEGAAREGAIGFSVQNKGFVGLGRNFNNMFLDMEEFYPDDPDNPND
jgi:hypothetical protein